MTMIGFGLIFTGSLKYVMSKNPLIPINDPELKNAINHRNN